MRTVMVAFFKFKIINFIKLLIIDNKLIIFSNRRLLCNPKFQIYLLTQTSFEKYSANVLDFTTPINYKPSLENLIEFFQNKLHSIMFKKELEKKRRLMKVIEECNEKFVEIDRTLKKKWEK